MTGQSPEQVLTSAQLVNTISHRQALLPRLGFQQGLHLEGGDQQSHSAVGPGDTNDLHNSGPLFKVGQSGQKNTTKAGLYIDIFCF